MIVGKKTPKDKLVGTVIVATGRIAAQIDPSYSSVGVNVHSISAWYLDSTLVCSPKGIPIGSADSAGLTVLTDKQTHGTSSYFNNCSLRNSNRCLASASESYDFKELYDCHCEMAALNCCRVYRIASK